MKSMKKVNLASDAATTDDGAVRLGEAALYFDTAADQRVKASPAEIADEGNVRLGDASLYFDPSADEAAKTAETK